MRADGTLRRRGRGPGLTLWWYINISSSPGRSLAARGWRRDEAYTRDDGTGDRAKSYPRHRGGTARDGERTKVTSHTARRLWRNTRVRLHCVHQSPPLPTDAAKNVVSFDVYLRPRVTAITLAAGVRRRRPVEKERRFGDVRLLVKANRRVISLGQSVSDRNSIVILCIIITQCVWRRDVCEYLKWQHERNFDDWCQVVRLLDSPRYMFYMLWPGGTGSPSFPCRDMRTRVCVCVRTKHALCTSGVTQ